MAVFPPNILNLACRTTFFVLLRAKLCDTLCFSEEPAVGQGGGERKRRGEQKFVLPAISIHG